MLKVYVDNVEGGLRIEDFSGDNWYPSTNYCSTVVDAAWEQCKRHYRNKLMRKVGMTHAKATYIASRVADRLWESVEVIILN